MNTLNYFNGIQGNFHSVCFSGEKVKDRIEVESEKEFEIIGLLQKQLEIDIQYLKDYFGKKRRKSTKDVFYLSQFNNIDVLFKDETEGQDLTLNDKLALNLAIDKLDELERKFVSLLLKGHTYTKIKTILQIAHLEGIKRNIQTVFYQEGLLDNVN